MKRLTFFTLICVAFLFSSNVGAQETEDYPTSSLVDPSPGSARIVINRKKQKAYLYKGEEVVAVSTISTGREGYRTPAGNFSIQSKEQKHKSSIYGDYVNKEGRVVRRDIDVRKDKRPPGTVFRGAPMPYNMHIVDGISLHQGKVPGYPASHGCIRLPAAMAKKFYKGAPIGTPVKIL